MCLQPDLYMYITALGCRRNPRHAGDITSSLSQSNRVGGHGTVLVKKLESAKYGAGNSALTWFFLFALQSHNRITLYITHSSVTHWYVHNCWSARPSDHI